MDILSGTNADWLSNLTWIAAFVALVLLGIRLLPDRRIDRVALGALLVFAVANVADAIYVLFHLGDGRWGGDAHAHLVAPSLAGTPMVGQFLQPIDGLLSGLADGMNEFNDVQTALPGVAGFLIAAGWAFLLAIPLCVAALVGSFIAARRRPRELTRVINQLDAVSAEVSELRRLAEEPALT